MPIAPRMEAHSTSPAAWEEGKVSRGWRLTMVAWALIRKDRTMMVLAAGGIVSAIVFAFLVLLVAGIGSGGDSGHALGPVILLALYPSTLASVFFNVALACAASAAFDGERLSAGEALRMAYGKRGRIAAWALISTLVGMLINELASRLPGGARLMAWLVGAAWGLATLFVVPILAMEGIGPVDAIKRSTGLVKDRWGEGIAGRVSIGAWSVVVAVPLGIMLGIGGALLEEHPGSGAALIGLGLAGLFALFAAVAATQQVFAVALYRYAIEAPIGGFSSADLAYPFIADPARQKRKSWILRIGGPILGLFVLLTVIVAIVGPRERHTAAEGWFHLDYVATNVPDFRPGTPVVYEHRQVGAIQSIEPSGTLVRVVFRVEPSLRYVVETQPALVGRVNGVAYLRIGRPPPGGAVAGRSS